MSRRSASEPGRKPHGPPAGAGAEPVGSVPSPLLHLNRLDEWPRVAGPEPALRRAAAQGLALGSRASGGRPGPEELSITFVTEEEIRELNRRYLKKDEPTDVLAFDLGSHGDVYISPGAAQRSAAERGIPAAEEVVRLIVHAALHLTGHDHPEDDTREDSPMFRLQEAVMAGLA